MGGKLNEPLIPAILRINALTGAGKESIVLTVESSTPVDEFKLIVLMFLSKYEVIILFEL